MLDPANKPCKDPKDKDGICIEILHCPHLSHILINRPISEKNRIFLKRSQCGYLDRVPYVCCADSEVEESSELPETTSEQPKVVEESDWLVALKQKLPKPPVCGLSVGDRIFGGEKTEIDDFPWVVLVQFDKRMIKILSNKLF